MWRYYHVRISERMSGEDSTIFFANFAHIPHILEAVWKRSVGQKLGIWVWINFFLIYPLLSLSIIVFMSQVKILQIFVSNPCLLAKCLHNIQYLWGIFSIINNIFGLLTTHFFTNSISCTLWCSWLLDDAKTSIRCHENLPKSRKNSALC